MTMEGLVASKLKIMEDKYKLQQSKFDQLKQEDASEQLKIK